MTLSSGRGDKTRCCMCAGCCSTIRYSFSLLFLRNTPEQPVYTAKFNKGELGRGRQCVVKIRDHIDTLINFPHELTVSTYGIGYAIFQGVFGNSHRDLVV